MTYISMAPVRVKLCTEEVLYAYVKRFAQLAIAEPNSETLQDILAYPVELHSILFERQLSSGFEVNANSEGYLFSSETIRPLHYKLPFQIYALDALQDNQPEQNFLGTATLTIPNIAPGMVEVLDGVFCYLRNSYAQHQISHQYDEGSLKIHFKGTQKQDLREKYMAFWNAAKDFNSEFLQE